MWVSLSSIKVDVLKFFNRHLNSSTLLSWHNDHGSLTGLLPALYLDPNGQVVDCLDPQAGLYIKSRAGELVHAQLPSNALMFQVGETMQVQSGGCLQATPHGECH